MATSDSSDSNKTCVVCCHDTNIWAVGECNHPTCLLCSARLRVLCKQNECPVCRLDLKQVFVVHKLKLYDELLSLHGWTKVTKYGMSFKSRTLVMEFRRITEYSCQLCPESHSFSSFRKLREHVNRVHNLHYCDICVDNLKLFPSEFKMYTRSKLTAHRRDGDSDDRSHRGHPWCEFCDERYLDNDALHSHLRKVHFWCHFCEVDGRQDYFPSVHALRAHFKSDHFLCEEGNCRNDILTSTFRNEIDLKAHKASTHSKGMSKADVKKMRCLPVDFAYSNSTSSSATGEYREGGAAAAARRRGNHLITNTGASSKKLMMVTRDTKSAQMREREETELAVALSLPPQQQQQHQPQSTATTRAPQTTITITTTATLSDKSNNSSNTNKRRPQTSHTSTKKKKLACSSQLEPKPSPSTAPLPAPRTPPKNRHNHDGNSAVTDENHEPVEEAVKTGRGGGSNQEVSVAAAVAKNPTNPAQQSDTSDGVNLNDSWPLLLVAGKAVASQPSDDNGDGGGGGASLPAPPPGLLLGSNDNHHQQQQQQQVSSTLPPPGLVDHQKSEQVGRSGNQTRPHPPPGYHSKSKPPRPPGLGSDQSKSFPPPGLSGDEFPLPGSSGRSLNNEANNEDSKKTATTPPPGFHEQSTGRHPKVAAKIGGSRVFEMIREALDGDESKFKEFQSLSGWYRNGEMSLEKYVKNCEGLFGGKWHSVGPQFAKVMPPGEQKDKLLALFNGTTGTKTRGVATSRNGGIGGNGWPVSSKKGKGKQQQQQHNAWLSGGGSGGGQGGHTTTTSSSLNLGVSEEDYPSLSSSSKMSQPKVPSYSNVWKVSVHS